MNIGDIQQWVSRLRSVPKVIVTFPKFTITQEFSLKDILGAMGMPQAFEKKVADILGNSPEIVRKHYAKWSLARQSRIDDLMERVHVGVNYGDENQTLQ
jgi:serine protease inhibitor